MQSHRLLSHYKPISINVAPHFDGYLKAREYFESKAVSSWFQTRIRQMLRSICTTENYKDIAICKWRVRLIFRCLRGIYNLSWVIFDNTGLKNQSISAVGAIQTHIGVHAATLSTLCIARKAVCNNTAQAICRLFVKFMDHLACWEYNWQPISSLLNAILDKSGTRVLPYLYLVCVCIAGYHPYVKHERITHNRTRRLDWPLVGYWMIKLHI